MLFGVLGLVYFGLGRGGVGWEQERLNGRLEGMKEAEGLFAHRKDLAFQLACTKEQAELLEIQR